MNTCFPARKQNGENYATLDEMMRLIGREPHGSWLAGTNKMWHGGIHVSEVSAPGSLLTPETIATAVPLPCMADGEVVAWRLGRDYQKARYLSHAVQYSTTFVLVKSVCKPDPDNAQTWLEFYSLYMGLAPLSAFEKCRCLKVIAAGGVRKHPQGQYESSQPDVIPGASESILAAGTRVVILKEGLFTYRGQSGQPFGLAQELDNEGRECGKPFWVTTSPEYMAPDGEAYARLPVWMQQAVAKGVFDAVVKPDTPLAVSAGDAIGFLGEDIAPAGMAKIRPSAYAHLEVLSTDSRMPGFLANPGGVNNGRKYIRIHPDAVLYIDSGETFIRTTTTVNKDKHLILPVDKCNPREWEGRTYYQAGKNYWLRQEDVDVLNQFDLNGLGFTALEEESTPDMSASIKEGWVTSTCRWLAEQVMPERGVRETLTSRFYQSVAEKLDSDRSGDLSGREVYAALHHPDMGVRDIVSRMVVKHESEWFGGSGHQKWTAFFQDYDTLRIDFAKKWLDDMEWMSQVAPFTAGQAVWHMHPVVFLDALRKKKTGWAHSPFADLLASVESKNDYTAYNRTWPHPNPIHSEAHYNTHLTSMTLNEVMKAQARYDMFATGRYQIIPETLEDAVKTLRLNIDALYNEMMQDKIFEEYLIKVKRKPIIEYLEGNGNVEEAIYAWAMEFSSAGVRKGKAISKGRVAHNEGVSYYSGDGLNRARLMPDEMIEVLKESKNEKN